MALVDFRVEPSFFNHRKTRALKAACGEHGVLCLLQLWAYAATHKPSGNLAGMSDRTIEIEAGWDQAGDEPLKFITQIRTPEFNFLDEFQLHDWGDHQPFLVSREARSERARRAAKARYASLETASSMRPACPEAKIGAASMLRACVEHENVPVVHAPSPSPSPTPPPSPSPLPSPTQLSLPDSVDNKPAALRSSGPSAGLDVDNSGGNPLDATIDLTWTTGKGWFLSEPERQMFLEAIRIVCGRENPAPLLAVLVQSYGPERLMYALARVRRRQTAAGGQLVAEPVGMIRDVLEKRPVTASALEGGDEMSWKEHLTIAEWYAKAFPVPTAQIANERMR